MGADAKRALICGVSGQDGAYLARLLLGKGYGLYAVSGILFNHESPLRPERFVTRKIVSTACRIARGSGEKLQLGDLSVQRDWGWAPEYVEAMWRMLQPELASSNLIFRISRSKFARLKEVSIPHLKTGQVTCY